jgi:DNA polymerase-1
MKTLIIDTQQLLYRSLFTVAGKADNMYVGVVYGTLTQLKSILSTVQPDRMLLCWDGKNSIRKKIYPEYKAQRIVEQISFDIESIFKGKEGLKMIFEVMDWNDWEIEGLEADDLIANAAMTYEGTKIIASTDNDLYQLLSSDTSLLDLKTKKEFTKQHFRSKYGIEPEKWSDYKALAGCPGDNVKGIKGIGEKRALEFLKRGRDCKQYDYIMSQKYAWEFNLCLVKLPLVTYKAPVLKPMKFNSDVMSDICDIYSFHSIQKFLPEWRRVFSGRA